MKTSFRRPRQLRIEDLLRRIPPDGTVLDVGCFGFRQLELATRLGLTDLRHAGVDVNDYAEVPPGFMFRAADLNHEPLPFDSDAFSLVVCSHVLEHVRDPVELFAECARVCRPGGLIYVETPSERSLWLPGFPFHHESFFSLSFFDDPTHVGRPQSPQGLYRLAKYLGCEPVEAGYRISWRARLAAPLLVPAALVMRRGRLLERIAWGAVGWASYMVAAKRQDRTGRPPLEYYIPAVR